MLTHPLTGKTGFDRSRRIEARLRSSSTLRSVAIIPWVATAGSHDHQRGHGEPLPAGVAPRRHGRPSSRAAGEPPTPADPRQISGAAALTFGLGQAGRLLGRSARRNGLQPYRNGQPSSPSAGWLEPLDPVRLRAGELLGPASKHTHRES